MKKAWFGPRRTGIGSMPVSWEGWLVSILVIAGLALSNVFLRPILLDLTGLSPLVVTLLIGVFWIALLVGIALFTFEKKPR